MSFRSVSVAAIAVAGVLAHPGQSGVAGAGVSSDGMPLEYLDDGESTRAACNDVSFQQWGVFLAENDVYDNTYGFIQGAQGTWTFSPGIRVFEFLTWAHGDIDDPDYEFEKFTVEAYDDDENLVGSLEVVDVDGTYEDYESYSMTFSERVVEIRVSFTAYFELGLSASALIPFLEGGLDCPDFDGGRYFEWLETRSGATAKSSTLPNTF